MTKKTKKVFTTARGSRVGETHPRARLTDEQVEWLRDLYDEGIVGYRNLAEAFRLVWGFSVPRITVAKIVQYERRNTTAERVKVIEVKEDIDLAP